MTFFDSERIIALDLRSHSFGFAVLEGGNLLDWGVKSFPGGVNAVRVPLAPKVIDLIAAYVPDSLVLKVPRRDASDALRELKEAAESRQVPAQFLTPRTIRNVFKGCRNKDQIAAAVCERFAELVSALPPKRKIWKSEDYRMRIFDAAATGIAYFENQKEVASIPPNYA